VFEQALLLQLYDPDRARILRQSKTPSTWRSFVGAFAPSAVQAASDTGRAPPNPREHGAGLHFLLEPTSSPLLTSQIENVKARYPECSFHFHDPLQNAGAAQGSQAFFGRVLAPQYHFDRASIVLSLDSNFLAEGPFWLRYARDFMKWRRSSDLNASLNRLYALESRYTPTGVAADHRFALPPSRVVLAAREIAAHLAALLPAGALPAPISAILERWRMSGHFPHAASIARDLFRERTRGIVLAGHRQPRGAHALAHLMNEMLGNNGRNVEYTESVIYEEGEPSHDIGALADTLRAGSVDKLVILGGNPAYTAPVDLDLAAMITRARESVYLGLYENETAARTGWFVPMAHTLESWGDARAYDGTASFVQPMIEPLTNGRTVHEALAAFLGELKVGPRELIQRHWSREDLPALLQRGFADDSTYPTISLPVDWKSVSALLSALEEALPPDPQALELSFDADLRVRDGAFTNNPWLLEMPEPITTLSWSNAALMDPATAHAHGIATNDRIALTSCGHSVVARALVFPGVAPRTIAVTLGWGRSGSETAAAGIGFNAYELRSRERPYFSKDFTLEKLGRPSAIDPRARAALGLDDLVLTQSGLSMEGRPIALETTIADLRAHPARFARYNETPPSLRATWPTTGVQWAMSIDLSACTGCSACVVACQAENNVPVVGKVNVMKHRQMHWLRIDRYLLDGQTPRLITEPMACQHCERAPCEYVCPVNATVHSPDGLNEMAYNRCVGTRFCSNNCPYKVRRFNWFNFNADLPSTRKMAMNPDVTVRQRGVMEKCTYCVQRIREADIRARIEGRRIARDEVRTACQQACPTRAITFGNINDPQDEVTQMRKSPRAFGVLVETNSEPRTRYLARVTNPNPDLSIEGSLLEAVEDKRKPSP
jgi:molybdopterin-containing oxidoreductase family iron-sulfur binding subunit